MKTKLGSVLLLSSLFAITACDRAVSNMQTVISDDCGKNWRLIEVSKTIPSRVGVCALKVTVPNYPMQGSANFRATFANRVLANVEASYEYTISDPVLFISEARYIGRQNSGGDSEANNLAAYESAENAIIDRRIREVASELLLTEDIVTFDQSKFEVRLLEELQPLLVERGVTMSTMAFVPIPDEQTRMAIDVAAANKVYESIGFTAETSQALLSARAGATRITVNASDTQVN